MALSDPRYIFGIHSFTPYNRTTGEFYTETRVLAGSQLVLTGEQIELRGGSSKYPYAIEDSTLNAEVTLTSREYPAWAFELFLGKTLTEGSAEASGNASTPANEYGTSVINASTGIASIVVDTASDLKFGKYIVKAVTADTVDIFAASDIDFARGTDGSFDDDDMSINASPLTVTTGGATTAITNFGLNIVGGSGTIALVAGDTASFEVRPVNDGYYTADFGGTSDTYSEFGAILYGQQHGSGRMMEIEVYKLKAIGMPINFNANEFSEFEITMKASYDSSKNKVFSMREIKI